MSAPAPEPLFRSRRTPHTGRGTPALPTVLGSAAGVTYSALTELAGSRIQDALEQAMHLDRLRELAVAEVIGAHFDLSAALAHLGMTLLRAHEADRREAATPHTPGSSHRLLAELVELGDPRDWTTAPPSGPICRDLDAAARMVRAAADLWAGHHTASGSPRSPQASRMRHPSVLGAAVRDWEGLVGAAGSVARSLLAWAEAADCEPGALERLKGFPRPSRPRGGPGPAPALPAARPIVRTGTGPMQELSDRVDRLHTLSWVLDRDACAPAHALRCLASIGAALSCAAATANPGQLGAPHIANRWATGMAGAWDAVCDLLSAVRTLHPTRTSLHVERLQILGLLERISAERRIRRSDVAPDLTRMAAAYSAVASHNLRAVRRAHARGEVLITGRAIPGEIVGRRSDLLQAKLHDLAVPAPNVAIRRIERAYEAVLEAAAESGPTAHPPAA